MQLKTLFKLCVIFGPLTLVWSAISYYGLNWIIEQKVHANVIVEPNSTAFKYWLHPPTKVYRGYYLFDVTNPDEVEQGKAKPHLVERGPYTYSEVWTKENVEFMGDEKVRYQPVTTLFFEPSLSNGSEEDTVRFLNVPVMGMIELATHGNSNVESAAVNEIIKLFEAPLFEKRTVRELISGYKDPLLVIAKTLLPKVVKDDTFSLINGQNGTTYETFVMRTGKTHAEEVAELLSWDQQESMNLWDSEYANQLNGSDGTFYPPFRTRDQKVYSFNPQMCRSYHLTYKEDGEQKGVKTFDYHLPKTLFYDTKSFPENKGFCDSGCLGDGVLNISKCYGNVSGFISQPHFLNADTKFVTDLDGLSPDDSKHDFILKFSPTTGVPLRGDIRFQISFYTTKNDKIDLVKNINPVLLPMFWFHEYYELDDDTTSQIKQVELIRKISTLTPIFLAAIGSMLILTALVTVPIRLSKNKNESQEQEVDEEQRQGRYQHQGSNQINSPSETTSLLANGNLDSSQY